MSVGRYNAAIKYSDQTDTCYALLNVTRDDFTGNRHDVSSFSPLSLLFFLSPLLNFTLSPLLVAENSPKPPSAIYQPSAPITDQKNLIIFDTFTRRYRLYNIYAVCHRVTDRSTFNRFYFFPTFFSLVVSIILTRDFFF